ncbi:MAG: hypothetical protein OEV60_01775 [Actinomycetota bacterium]|nr:hypothetical protein [Actinomycetota bacterium]MDH5224679.1 hypothetical protein [Actinomycetota bacterium]MDH5312346.1 hypothetical protein [Actinomycetota bacterium]
MAVALRTAIGDARSGAIPSADVRPRAAIVAGLGRIEARRLVRHPTFWLGTAFGLTLTRGVVGAGSGSSGSTTLAWLAGGLALGMLVGTLLSANVAALRSRRDRTGELYGSLPSPPEARTLGLLTGLAVGPVTIAIVLAAVAWAVFSRTEGLAEHTDLFLAVQYPLAVFALGAIGVGVARWIPTLLGGPIIVVLHTMTPLIWLVPWILPTTSEVHATWHMIYLVAVPVTWVALALARDRRTLIRFAVAAAALALGIVAAVQQTPPGGY